jgi:uncharacterized protein YdeI (YjbR/CyaY-like superfamily)
VKQCEGVTELKWLMTIYIRNQQDATLAVSFISHCKITCFGRFLRPSSGVLKTVVAATSHGSG